MKTTVTVGICALNEEKTIKKVIEQVLSQQENQWTLKEIRVYSDGSTDGTVTQAQSVKDKRLTVIPSPVRKGKTFRLQQLFDESKGDIVVMFDADISIKGNSVVSTLINAFEDPNVALVGGNSRPFAPRTFFEKAVYSTFRIFYASRLKIRGGNSIFGATGSIMAGRTSFLRSFRFPSIINEDAFVYMTCLSQGLKFRYVDEAVIEYKLPNNARDYVKQVLRSEPGSVSHELEKYFGEDVRQEFARPLGFYVYSVLIELMRNPIGVSYIIILNILCRWFAPHVLKNYKLEWFTAHSTH